MWDCRFVDEGNGGVPGSRFVADVYRQFRLLLTLRLTHESGYYADFHSLRKTFITNLSRSGVSPKTAQTSVRHSDIKLTTNTYTMLVVWAKRVR